MQETLNAYQRNLTEQKNLFVEMLAIAKAQGGAAEKGPEILPGSALEQLQAQRQNLIERINALEEEAHTLQAGLLPGLGTRAFFPLFNDLFALMQEIKQQDELTQALIHTAWRKTGAQVQKLREANKTALVYQGYGSGISTDSRFIDYKK